MDGKRLVRLAGVALGVFLVMLVGIVTCGPNPSSEHRESVADLGPTQAALDQVLADLRSTYRSRGYRFRGEVRASGTVRVYVTVTDGLADRALAGAATNCTWGLPDMTTYTVIAEDAAGNILAHRTDPAHLNTAR